MESDDENQDYDRSAGTNGCVILIDVSPPMWDEYSDENDENPIGVVLSSCVNLIQKMMINSPRQLIGISLFGTEKDGDQGIKNVIQLMQLKEPAVEDILHLKDYVLNPAKIKNEWGTTNNFSLADALWQASRMFSACHKKMSRQTVTLMSCLKPPDSSIHKFILKKVSNVRELGININIINVSDKNIPSDSFYMELGKVISDQSNLEWEPPEPMTDVNDILTLIWNNSHKKSATALLKMYLGPDVVLGVGLYSLCKQRSPPRKHCLHREDNELVISSNVLKRQPAERNEVSQENDADDFTNSPPTQPEMDLLLKTDLILYQDYGGRRIEITCEEENQLKKFAGPPCIKLLGFKSASFLNMSEWFLKSSGFIYPNESLVEGSTTLFLALRDRCLALGRVAICLMLSRWFSNTRFVALVPQQRIMKEGRQLQPDGFHVIYLPYADNFKELSLEDHAEVTDEQRQCLEKILNKLKYYHSGDVFENPKLQTLYKAIEALALDESAPEEIDDTTVPNIEEQNERLGSLQEEFNSLFGPMTVSAVKRSKNDDKPNKKMATQDSDQMDTDMVIARIKNCSVEKYTVAQLKLILKMSSVPNLPAISGLKKEQLVRLVYDNTQTVLASFEKAD